MGYLTEKARQLQRLALDIDGSITDGGISVGETIPVSHGILASLKAEFN